MPSPYLAQRRRKNASRYTLPVGTPSDLGQGDDGGSGLFGLGFGPDVDLGLGTLVRGIGQGVSALGGIATSLAPGGEAARWDDVGNMGRGLVSSLAGTGITAAKPVLGLADVFYEGDLEEDAERLVGRALGDEERFTAEDFMERAKNRGLASALFETVGDVAIVGGAITAPVRGASAAARLGGASETAARLAATHGRLIANRSIRAMQHPYLTAGAKVRNRFLRPAAETVEAASGIKTIDEFDADALDAETMDPDFGDVDTTPDDLGLESEVDDGAVLTETPEPLPPTPGAGTRFLAGVEKRLQGLDAGKKIREETRLAEMERAIAGRSAAVRGAAAIARDRIIDAGREAGLNISRREASLIVGDELRARLSGTKVLEDEYLSRGVTEADIVRAGVRERFIPGPLRGNPDLQAALDDVVLAHQAEATKTRQTLLESRPGDKGLDPEGAFEPALTKKQEKALRLAEKKLERAYGDVLARIEGRQRTSHEHQIAVAEDKLGRIAAEAQRLDDEAAGAVADFELSREMRPKSWKQDGAMEASTEDVYTETMANVAEHAAAGEGEWGGASFNPHTGEFIRGGSQPGYAVGLVSGDGRSVALADFTAQDIEHVVRAHQDVYSHPNTIVGTWVENGKVAIDPAEVVDDLTEAIIRAAARGQDSIYDIAGDRVIKGILQDKPGVAIPFLKRHVNLSRRATELRRIAKVAGWTDDDVHQMLGIQMVEAVAGTKQGRFKHPDEFFATHTFKAAKEASKAPGALNQVVLNRVLDRSLYDEAEAAVAGARHARDWYRRSNRIGVGLLANSPDVTLVDGSTVPASDLFFQILAATSVNEGPRTNWTKAVASFQAIDDLPKNAKKLLGPIKRLAEGKATIEETVPVIVKYLEQEKTGSLPLAKRYVAEILGGHTVDKWSAESLSRLNEALGGATPDRATAVDWIKENAPEALDRLGEDAAVKEFWGEKHRAKIMSFYDNLRDPENSLAVTWDTQMKRLVGEDVAAMRGGWLEGSEQMRNLAAELSEAFGEHVTPNELQALFWVFAKDEVARITMGHYRALAEDTVDLIKAGAKITDDADPMLQWADEAGEAFTSPETKFTRDRRIVREPAAPEPVEHAAFGAGTLDALFPEGGLRTTVPWKQARKSKDLQDFDKATVGKAISGEQGDLVPVDPRTLQATQPNITRAGVDYYLSGKGDPLDVPAPFRQAPGSEVRQYVKDLSDEDLLDQYEGAMEQAAHYQERAGSATPEDLIKTADLHEQGAPIFIHDAVMARDFYLEAGELLAELQRRGKAGGKTFADGGKAGNDVPTVYARPKFDDPRQIEHVLLTGHHRAAAAMLRGEPLMARVVDGPWGDARPGRTAPKMPHRGEAVEQVGYNRRLAAATRKEGIGIIDTRKARWLATRDLVNAALETGDVDLALQHFNDFDTLIRTTNPRHGGLLDGAAGADFMDLWMDEDFWSAGYLRANKDFPRFEWLPGEMPPLMQAFKDKVLGQFVPGSDTTRATIRFFEDANPATFVHENGHLLRTMLTKAQMDTVERLYGIKGGVWDVAHEERWADDFLNYFRTGKAPKGLQTTFERVRQVLRDTWDMVKGTFYRRTVPPELRAVFDEWLDPDVSGLVDEAGPYPGLDVTPETGTLRQRVTRPPKFKQPPAKSGDFYASGRKGQAALARLEKVAMRQRQLAATKAKVEKTKAAIESVLAEGRLPAELERDKLVAEAMRIQDTVNEQLGRPATRNVPARWQPVYDASKSLLKIAEGNPALAGMLEDLPQTLHEVQQLALSNGFDPVHVRDFSPTQVRRLVFANMRLGLGRDSLLQETSAGTRKTRTGTLARAGGVDRSVEALLASVVEATLEKRTNAVVDWVEQNAARKIAKGTPIPDGWQAWDPLRTYVLTGTEVSADGMKSVPTAAKDVMIVPDSVVRTVHRYTKDYDHWALRGIRKVTSPWRTLVLTLSPGWYVRNFVGNVMLAESQGVRLADWKAAWRSARTKDEIGRFADLPFVTSDTLAHEAAAMADESVIPRRGLREAQAEGGRVRGLAQHVSRKMLRVNEVVDEFARAAVYHQGVRKSLAPEEAWHRAKEALVDYGALTPFEREAVRAVIPFYAWQKGILRVTMHHALDHPARVEMLALLGQVQEDYIAERFGMDPEDIPNYYKHLAGGYNIKSFNPFSDPAEIVTVEGITRSFNPFLELAIRKGLGAPEFYTDDQRLGYFGTPQSDVNVPQELSEIVTRSPGGRIIGEGPGTNILGLTPVDEDALRSRFLRARRQIRGIPNPETGTPQEPLLRAG